MFYTEVSESEERFLRDDLRNAYEYWGSVGQEITRKGSIIRVQPTSMKELEDVMSGDMSDPGGPGKEVAYTLAAFTAYHRLRPEVAARVVGPDEQLPPSRPEVLRLAGWHRLILKCPKAYRDSRLLADIEISGGVLFLRFPGGYRSVGMATESLTDELCDPAIQWRQSPYESDREFRYCRILSRPSHKYSGTATHIA